jgi:hypothetical protein
MMRGSWGIVRIAERPDLVPLVANWLWDAFWQPNGHRLDEVREILAEATAETGTPQSFVLLAGGVPCGTASFMSSDLEIRNDLGPWLAGVYVVPEDAARQAGHAALFLYTDDAQSLYEKLGWYAIEETVDNNRPVTIMRRDL